MAKENFVIEFKALNDRIDYVLSEIKDTQRNFEKLTRTKDDGVGIGNFFCVLFFVSIFLALVSWLGFAWSSSEYYLRGFEKSGTIFTLLTLIWAGFVAMAINAGDIK